jgi:multiple sugar transport system permease protein
MKKGQRLFSFLMLLPAMVCIFAICIYPVFSGIFMSFTNASLMRPGIAKFIGLNNFIKVFGDSEFGQDLGFTLVYAFSTVVLSYVLGLICALLMNRKIKFRGALRAMFLTPWVVPVVVGETAWTWILNDQCGLINLMLERWGIISKPILFLSNANTAKMTVILFATWKAFPFMAVVLLSSLQSIPEDIYEACEIDGAGRWRTFINITLPLIRKESLLVILLQSMWMINNFDNIFLLTKGGPALATEVMSIYSYNTAFYRSSMGYASAISVMMMLFMIVLSTVYFAINKHNSEVY